MINKVYKFNIIKTIKRGMIPLIFCLFIFFFNIKIKGFPITSNMLLGGLGILLLLSKLFFCRHFKLEKNFLFLLFSYVLLLSALVVAFVVHGTFDLSLIKIFIVNFPIVFLGAFFISHIISKNNLKLEDVFKAITICFFIQCLITLIFFINRNLMYNVLEICDMDDRIKDIVSSNQKRAFGFFFGFDYGTAELTCSCLCGTYLVLTEKKQYNLWLFIVIVSSLIGLLVARTMFVGILLVLFFFFVFPCEYKFRKKKIFFSFLYCSFIILFILILCVDLSKYQKTFLWMTDFVTQINNGGLKRGSLYEIIYNMVWFPEYKTFFFGDGWFKLDGRQYMDTDVGYMRLILYFGLFGTFLVILFIVNLGKAFWHGIKNKQLNKLSFLFVLVQLIFMYKIMYLIMGFFTLFILLKPSINSNHNKYSNFQNYFKPNYSFQIRSFFL